SNKIVASVDKSHLIFSNEFFISILSCLVKVTISRYENNLREPKRETISQFAKLFNVSTDYLHGHTNDKFTLTKQDKIDIKNSLEKIKCDLSTDETILFDGEPMCKEAIESLLTAMEVGLSLVKQKQKRDNNI
ncbi:helix-turn-helix domain-containing protein, partial [Romboutsia ilealis]|uniref:helix-turn-helix domain-containing protein n=1 Tax=Romboutsia ilealis TaxID=1115758 RepID=UPI00272B8FD0